MPNKKKTAKKVEKKLTKEEQRKATLQADKEAFDYFKKNEDTQKRWESILSNIFKQHDIDMSLNAINAFVSGLALASIDNADLTSLTAFCMSKRHELREEK